MGFQPLTFTLTHPHIHNMLCCSTFFPFHYFALKKKKKGKGQQKIKTKTKTKNKIKYCFGDLLQRRRKKARREENERKCYIVGE